MDDPHILAADRLISAVADNNHFIPFTWAISRLFNALILLVGTAIFLLPMRSRKQRDMRFILGISAVFGVVSFVIMISMARTDPPPPAVPLRVLVQSSLALGVRTPESRKIQERLIRPDRLRGWWPKVSHSGGRGDEPH